jgi:hypothetical protein
VCSAASSADLTPFVLLQEISQKSSPIQTTDKTFSLHKNSCLSVH